MNNTPFKSTIKRLGGPSRLARMCNVSHATVIRSWYRRGVPIERVPLISRATGMPKHEIRPDLPDIFPPPLDLEAA